MIIHGGTLEALFAVMFVPPQPYNWTTDPTVLAWIAVASLIIGVVGIILGGVLAFIFYQKGKNWHRVVYQVISDTQIVSVREQTGRGKIKVTYEANDGHTEDINDARLLTLKVLNVGNGDLNIWSIEDKGKAGMEVPIEFEFEGRKVVGLTHLETDPSGKVISQEDSDAYLKSSPPTQTSLGLPSCILKQDQSIQLGVLLNGPSGNVKLKAGKLFNGEILDTRDLVRRSNLTRSIIVFTSIILIFGILILIQKILPNSQIPVIIILGLIAGVAGLITSYLQTFSDKFYGLIRKNLKGKLK